MTSVSLPDPVIRGTRRPHVDAAALERALRERVDGEVRFDPASRATYSTDASNYRQVPIGRPPASPRDFDTRRPASLRGGPPGRHARIHPQWRPDAYRANQAAPPVPAHSRHRITDCRRSRAAFQWRRRRIGRF
jgi:hypothetical protein